MSPECRIKVFPILDKEKQTNILAYVSRDERISIYKSADSDVRSSIMALNGFVTTDFLSTLKQDDRAELAYMYRDIIPGIGAIIAGMTKDKQDAMTAAIQVREDEKKEEDKKERKRTRPKKKGGCRPF